MKAIEPKHNTHGCTPNITIAQSKNILKRTLLSVALITSNIIKKYLNSNLLYAVTELSSFLKGDFTRRRFNAC